MSLINDALKRASSSKPSGPPPPGGGPALQPVPGDSSRTGALPIILCLVGIGALLMAAAFWLKSRGTSATGELAARSDLPVQNASVVKNPLVATVPSDASNSTPAPQPFPRNAAQAPIESSVTPLQKPIGEHNGQTSLAPIQPPATLPASVPPPAVAAVAPRAPAFRLQAIYYRMKGPSVVINGKTVRVGEEIDGARLVSIERNAAEIEYQGARQKLTIH